tara:strand:- start:1229 stop:2362 length:1134 start_codon:yes stop_codon:yes gene_type:complete
MNFIDLKSQYAILGDGIRGRINAVLDHGQYVLGPEVYELEEKLASYNGVRHCVSCSSGTDALLMALMAKGIGPKDAVFVPSLTFIATAEVVSMLGATPIFVDIDKETFNMCPVDLRKKVEKIEDMLWLTSKCVIPVDLFGLPTSEEISSVAFDHGLFVLKDCAQSFGASISGAKSCSLGHASTTSFYPAKPLGCYGDGGAVFTDDDSLAEELVSIRNHGASKEHVYFHNRVGINGRLDTIQAAVLLEKLKIFDAENERRQKIARLYSEQLGKQFTLQRVPDNYESSWAQFSVLASIHDERDNCLNALKENSIPSAIHYPLPLHKQEVFKLLRGEAPIAESHSSRIFSLPMNPYLSDSEVGRVCDVLNDNSTALGIKQ